MHHFSTGTHRGGPKQFATPGKIFHGAPWPWCDSAVHLPSGGASIYGLMNPIWASGVPQGSMLVSFLLSVIVEKASADNS